MQIQIQIQIFSQMHLSASLSAIQKSNDGFNAPRQLLTMVMVMMMRMMMMMMMMIMMMMTMTMHGKCQHCPDERFNVNEWFNLG